MVERWQLSRSPEGSGTGVDLYRDGFQVYHCEFPSMLHALARLPEKVWQIDHLPVLINSRKDVDDHVIGRDIYYREQPAVITAFDGFTGRVAIRSADGKPFAPEPWDGDDATGDALVWEDLLSPKIHWHREE